MTSKNLSSRFINAKSIMCLTIFSLFLLGTNADNFTIASTNPPQTIGISKSSPRVVLGLDYQNAFEMSLSSLDNSGVEFCEPFPSEISQNLKFDGPIYFQYPYDFDNIVTYKGFHFLVDTRSFYILAIEDLVKREKQYVIKSPMNNTEVEREYDEVFVALDEANGVLFIVTSRVLMTYQLNAFLEARSKNSPTYPVATVAKNFEELESISNIRFYRNTLYIVADNSVLVWLTVANGDVAPLNKRLNETFFKVPTFSPVDIAFYEDRGFILDSIYGVYVINVAGAAQSNFIVEAARHKIEKGVFIETIKNSLQIVTSSKKNTKLFEYIIQPPKGSGSVTLVLNRVLDMFQAVSDIYADENFLYLITGFFNVAVRPMIPGNYDSEFVEAYVMNYWTLFNIRGIFTTKNGASSQVIAVQDKTISMYSFDQESPAIQCDIENVPNGEYMYQLKVLQTECEDKTTTDINVVCQAKQNIRFVVAESESIGDVSQSNKVSMGLGVGLGIMTLMIIIFCVLVRKYKKQYKALESQFKFRKLKEEGGDAEGGVASRPE
jgi:hypothetical protein